MVDSNVYHVLLLRNLEGQCVAILTRKVEGQKITVTSRRVIHSVVHHHQNNGLSSYFSLLSYKSQHCVVDGKSGFHSSPDCQRGPRTLGLRVPLCLPKLKPFPTYRNDLRMTLLSLRSANATESPSHSKLQNHTYQNVNL